MRRLYRLPCHDAGALRLAAEQLAALRDVEPRAISAAERDAGQRRAAELRRVQNVRAAPWLLAHLNAHRGCGPHVTEGVDREAGDSTEQSFLGHFQALERLAVHERSIGRDLKRPLIAI